MSDLTNYNPNDLMKGVKDRIKKEFVSLIPDEAWENMIKVEIDKFTKDQKNNYGQIQKSGLSVMIKTELQDYFRSKIKGYMGSEEMNITYNEQGEQLPEIVKKALIDNAPQMFASLISSSVITMINSIQNDVAGRQHF